MRSEHLVPLQSTSTVFSPNWAKGAIEAAYSHELYGTEQFMVRTLTLNTLTWAKYCIAADTPYPVTDRRYKERRPE